MVAALWLVVGVVTVCWAAELRDELSARADLAPLARAGDVLVDLSERLGLDRVRALSEDVRSALYGHERARAPVPAALAPTGSATLAPHRAAPSPRRVLLVGASSMQFALGQALERALARYRDLYVYRFGKAATGLARPDHFDWQAQLDRLLDAQTPELVIANFGGNDAQNIPLDGSARAEFGSEAWDALYGSRVEEFVARIRARGALAIVIGMPAMRSASFGARMERLNRVTEAATERAGGVYVDQWDLALESDGRLREQVVERGRERAMRLPDGVHFTDPGGRFVVEKLLPRLLRHVRLVPKDATLGVMESHDFDAPALAARARYLAWLPQLAEGERVPWIVLLHGADARPEDFAEQLSSELGRFVQEHRVAVVAPDGGPSSWWLDADRVPASRYGTLVTRDLIADVEAHLPVEGRRGIVGISMGGHGALSLALARPGTFVSASSVSGVLDLTRAADRPALVALLGPLTERRARWEARSVKHVLKRTPSRARGLALLFACGRQDRWFEVNRALHDELVARGVSHRFEHADGNHSWSYWSQVLPAQLAWHAEQLIRRP